MDLGWHTAPRARRSSAAPPKTGSRPCSDPAPWCDCAVSVATGVLCESLKLEIYSGYTIYSGSPTCTYIYTTRPPYNDAS
eukprot:5421574-Prymnesium_polylepis.2